jgi:hypothetical protein
LYVISFASGAWVLMCSALRQLNLIIHLHRIGQKPQTNISSLSCTH